MKILCGIEKVPDLSPICDVVDVAEENVDKNIKSIETFEERNIAHRAMFKTLGSAGN